jgi:uncharacterized protein
MNRLIVLFLAVAAVASAAPKRVLYLTHSAGYRHDSIPASIDVLKQLAPETLAVTATEDLSVISTEGLRDYDALFFFTSGELALSDAQKAALLAFVRSGKGFGGAHSATDTLYTWPEYKSLIGATFDGHPWVQKIRVDVAEPDHPIVKHLAPGFEMEDEIYQHRDFSRDRLRVLLTVDTTSVNVHAPGVHRTDGDFALAWVQPYGNGRVFYTALGHFDQTWRDARFQQMLRQALLWMTGQIDAPSAPKAVSRPQFDAGGVGNAATMSPAALSPGVIFTVFGTHLTSGEIAAALSPQAPRQLAGTVVRLNEQPVPLFYASPGQINAVAPIDLATGPARLEISVPGAPAAVAPVPVQERTPGIFATTVNGDGTATIWATGFGLGWAPRVELNGVDATVLFSGLAPGWTGLNQVNVALPPGVPAPFDVQLRE